MRGTLVATMIYVLFTGGCSEDAHRCDPSNPDSCGSGARCVALEGGGGVCEDLAACDAADPASCPSGFVCRPAPGGGAFCEPEPTAGRIPSCIDSEGMDVFAVEANGALSVTWNVNASIDSSGGFAVAYGFAAGEHDVGVTVGPRASAS